MSERYQGLRFERRKPKWLPPVIFVVVIVAIIGGILGINHTYTEYIKLDYADKLIIDEFEKLYENEKNLSEVNDMNLKDKTFVFISEDGFRAFVINSKTMKNDLFSQKVELNNRYQITVYKVSILNPSLIKLLLSPDTPVPGKTYKLNGEEVYYYRYNRDSNVDEKNSSNHFGVEFIFNMYNYYNQKDWMPLTDINSSMVTNEIYESYSEVFSQLSNLQFELGNEFPDKQKASEYAYQYVRAIEKMKDIDPEYVNKILYRETYMGVPRYYSIKAAQAINYNYGIMYYDNTQNVEFKSVIPSINSGGVSKSFLYERGSYEIGAQICEFLDFVGVDYRAKIAENGPNNKVTLFDILVEYLDVPEDL